VSLEVSVLPPNAGGWIRWSGRLLEKYDPEVTAALEATSRTLDEAAVHETLRAGDTLIVDQRKYLHGRTALGEHQEQYLPEERRLIVQCYIDPERVL
jgi:hypothetical protein